MTALGIYIGGGIAGAGLLLVMVAVVFVWLKERDPAITPVEHVERAPPSKKNYDSHSTTKPAHSAQNHANDEWTVDMAGQSHTQDYALGVEQSQRSKVAWS